MLASKGLIGRTYKPSIEAILLHAVSLIEDPHAVLTCNWRTTLFFLEIAT